jgi:hypothetical protein
VTFNPLSPGTPIPVALPGGAQGFDSVACPAATQCTAVGWGEQEVTFNPRSPGAPTPVTISNGQYTPTSVACPSLSQCTSVDQDGREVTFDPRSPGTPTPVTIDAGNNNLLSVACPSSTQCTTVEYGGGLGREVTFNPQSPGAPTPATIGAGLNFIAVTCPSATQCTAAARGGDQSTFNPQAPGTPTPQTIDSGAWMFDITCISASDCLAVDNHGTVFEGDPTSASAWTTHTFPSENNLAGVSCVSASECAIVSDPIPFPGERNVGNEYFATDGSVPLPPAWTGILPSVSGTATVGQSLSESHGSWSPSPTGYTYQWEDCDSSGNNCTAINGATSPSYTVTAADEGSTIRVWETGSNAASAGGPALSAATSVVPGPPALTGAGPSISGTSAVGQMLTESHGSWSFSPTSYTLQWGDCDSVGNNCTAINGATSQSYTLTAADIGHTIRVQETAANATGESAPAVSAATAVVPSLLGTPRVGPVTTRGSRASVTLGCSGSTGALCNLTLTLTATERLRKGKVVAVTAGKRHGTKSVLLASVTTTIDAGQSQRLTVSLNATGRRLLAARRSLTVRLTVDAATEVISTRSLTFKARGT